jgi:glycerophosphoryl diester phosphodiesterase
MITRTPLFTLHCSFLFAMICCSVSTIRAEEKSAEAVKKNVSQEKSNHVDTKLFLRKPRHGGVYVVAHRGAHIGIPENSLPAYQKAIDLEADFVEIDVRTTKDGKFVSVHNSTIDAYVKNESGKVEDMTLAELRALDIGLCVHPKWAGTQVPTLAEVLDLCKGKIGIYLDLKDGDVSNLVEVIKQHGMERDILWYASPDELEELGQCCSQCTAMPDPYLEQNLPGLIDRLKPRVIAAVWKQYSKTFVTTCHEAGAIVIVDESDPSCWEDALAWKSDGIQTDHPEKLIAFLKARDVEE